MATRIEKETLLRQKAQLEAKLDKLFASQESQTVGKKRSKEFCRGGRVKRRHAYGETIGQPTEIPGVNALYPQTPLSMTGMPGRVQSQTARQPNTSLGQTQPLPGINYQSFLNRQGGSGGNNMFPNQGRGLMQGIGTAMSFAGSLYDIGRGLSKPTQFNAQDYYNPQYGRAISEYNKGIGLMRNRRYDPSAELEDVERTGAVYRQGLRNLPTSTGGLYNRLASQTSREQRQKGGIYTKKQNIDLGYRGEEAQYRAGAARGFAALGSERARTKFSIADYNERNRAARRNMISAGLGGLGMGAQTQQLMGNQRMRDEQLMGILPSYGGGLYNMGAQDIQFGGDPYDYDENRRYVRGQGYR